MKKLLLTLVAFCAALAAAAQTPDTTAAEGYRFTDVKLIPMTPVKDQSRSGTCWCYSTLSFLEGEILRAGGAPVHLSEMWIVRHTFMEKAVKYIRMHGEINFAEGGASRDVTEGIRNYGIVPFEAYPGFNYGTEKADFHELSRVLKAYLDAVMEASTKSSNKPLSTAWKRGFNAILDEYFGPMPETFTYQGKEYTPRTFALRRILVFLAPVRRLQDNLGHGQQARPAQRDRQEAGHQITRAQRQQPRRSPCRQAAGSPKRKAA